MRSVLAAAAVVIAMTSSALAADLAPVRAWRVTQERDIVRQLADFTAIPSIAADPKGLQTMADRLQAELAKRGFEARLLSAGAGDPPSVYGALSTPGAKRTVVFYAHYDGQPVTPSQWRSDPFRPVMRAGIGDDARDIDWQGVTGRLDPEWRLFGRGTSDDKSSIVAFLAAFDALKASGQKPSVNIKVFWEGEEEAGSPHLEAVLKANRDLLAADLWLIGDAPVHQSRLPTIYFGARGVMGVDATIYGPTRALHDGHYGNWAPNPAAMAAQLMADMRAPDGRIRIPGFDSDVRPSTPAELKAVAALPDVDAALQRDLGIAAPETREGLARSILRPSLNYRGLSAGRVGAAAVNAIPTEAVLSIDFRLVPNQTPASVRAKLEAYLRATGWTVVDAPPTAAQRAASAKIIRLAWEGGYPALRSDMASPHAQAVLAAAGRAAGRPVAVLPTIGGSVPIYLFDEVLGAPVIGLPIGNHDNNQHAANENTRLQNLWDGIDLYAAMMSDLRW